MSRSGSGAGRRAHDRCWDLLPWYANRSLDPVERELVEDHLDGCPSCREELRQCQRLASLVTASGELAPEPHPVGLQALLERLDEEPSAPEPGRWKQLGALREALQTLRWGPPALRLVVAAQLLLLALLGGWLWRSGSEVRYHTLADAETTAPAVAAARLRVVFEPQTSEAAIRDLLLEVEGEIVAGPSRLGVYTLELRPSAQRHPTRLVVEHLRRDRRVLLVEEVTP